MKRWAAHAVVATTIAITGDAESMDPILRGGEPILTRAAEQMG